MKGSQSRNRDTAEQLLEEMLKLLEERALAEQFASTGGEDALDHLVRLLDNPQARPTREQLDSFFLGHASDQDTEAVLKAAAASRGLIREVLEMHDCLDRLSDPRFRNLFDKKYEKEREKVSRKHQNEKEALLAKQRSVNAPATVSEQD